MAIYTYAALEAFWFLTTGMSYLNVVFGAKCRKQIRNRPVKEISEIFFVSEGAENKATKFLSNSFDSMKQHTQKKEYNIFCPVEYNQRRWILLDGRAKMDNEGSEANWTQYVAF